MEGLQTHANIIGAVFSEIVKKSLAEERRKKAKRVVSATPALQQPTIAVRGSITKIKNERHIYYKKTASFGSDWENFHPSIRPSLILHVLNSIKKMVSTHNIC